jgi:muconate cycloisomerase
LYGTLTHSNAVIVKVTLKNSHVGWGEADPGGKNFDGENLQSTIQKLRTWAPELIGQKGDQWVNEKRGLIYAGAPAAALDVACYDALGHALQQPVWQLLGKKVHKQIDSLWPTSSGSSDDDLAVIAKYSAQGFKTFMLKMGNNSIEDDIQRLKTVINSVGSGIKIMVDANQGWSLEQAKAFVDGTNDLSIELIEQPVVANDISGMHELRQRANNFISADESAQSINQVKTILANQAADIFSLKISKNGGFTNCLEIANLIQKGNKLIMLNSMIELGITQAASLHLGATLNNLVTCGHAFMSTLRMADDITNFSERVINGSVLIPDTPGLGITVFEDKLKTYQVDTFHVC